MNEEIIKIIDQIKNESDFFNKAKLLKFLNRQKQIRIKDLGLKLNLKPAYICHILRLNRLPDLVIDGYYSKIISISHLFIISRLKNQSSIVSVYETVLKNNLTVLQTEELVRESLYNIKTSGIFLSKKSINEFKQKIEKDNLNLKIIQTRIKSKIILEIKGNLAKTTPVIENILKKLIQ